MASLSSSRILRPSLLSLPPQLRAQIYQHRAFSASCTHKSTFVDLAVTGPSFVLDTIHNLGIPWHTTIPLTALLVRSTLVYYISTLPSRKAAQSNNTLVPLVNAYVLLQQNSDENRAKQLRHSRQSTPMLVVVVDYYWTRLKNNFKGAWKYGSKFGNTPWRRLGGGFLNFGVLIAFTEAIRMKCGSREGLLSLVLSPFERLGRALAPDQFPKVEDIQKLNPVQQLVWKLEAAQAAKEAKTSAAQGGELVDLSAHTSATGEKGVRELMKEQDIDLSSAVQGPNTSSPFFDPTMQTEGLLWCPDLTIPDPTGALTLGVTVTMAASFLLRPVLNKPPVKPKTTSNDSNQPQKPPEAQLHPSAPDPSKPLATQPQPIVHRIRSWGPFTKFTFGQRIGLSFAFLFAAISANMPAAILLYFIPSIAIGWAQNRWLDIRYPIRPAIRPCSRPLRVKKVREW